MHLITIIIPCYNSYEKMSKNLYSLENQSNKNFEVIIIDDCSQDGTFQNLLEYQKLSKIDIRILKNNKNSGPGFSRNEGLLHVQTDYITFLDSDDYLCENFIQEISEVILNYKPDAIIFNYIGIKRGVKINHNTIHNENEGFIEKSKALIKVAGSTWCKVFKSKIIKQNGFLFPDFRRNEDMPFNKLVISKCENIYYLNKNLYYYVFNKDSLMNNSDLLNINNAILAFDYIKLNIDINYEKELKAIFAKEVVYGTIVTLIELGKSREYILGCFEEINNSYIGWEEGIKENEFSFYHSLFFKFLTNRQIYMLKMLLNTRKFIKKLVN